MYMGTVFHKTDRLFVWVAFMVLSLVSPAQDLAVGHWRTHFAPSAVIQMAQRDVDMFGAMESSLLYVDTRDDILYEMDRTDDLSGVGISALAYGTLYDALVVGYSDGMLDLVYGMDVVPLSYIRDADFDGDKAIHQVWVDGRYAYLATGFGVVVVDLRKEEIKETYFIGQNNSRETVKGICVDENLIYALTDAGLKYASKNASNLNDFAAWTLDSASMPLSGSLQHCALAWDEVVVSDENQVAVGLPGQSWEEIPLRASSSVAHVEGFGDKLTVVYYDTSWGWRVDVFGADRELEYTTEGTRLPGLSSACLDKAGNLWIGCQDGEMIRLEMPDGRKTYFQHEGPVSDRCFELTKKGKSLLVAGGGYGNAFQPSDVPFEVSAFENGDWTVYNSESVRVAGLPSSVRSVVQAVEDPHQDGHYFAATSMSGLVEIMPDGGMKQHTPENSTLEYNNANHESCRVYGLDFDADGNLWVLNTLSDAAMHRMDRNGNWTAYDLRVSGLVPDRVSDLLVDYWQHQWVIFNNESLAVYETDGNHIKGLQVNMNNGNDLNTSRIFCLVEDDLGHIWIGTDRGVKVIDQHARMFESPNGNYTSVPVNTVRVTRDGYLVNLLDDNQVTAIAVDGGNRKWLGTNSNGLYLVSSDGTEEILHFTTANSPLFSDRIQDIAIDDRTGEVFIATDRGLLSYRSTATRTEGDPKEEARAFPNPVRPGYQGLINVKGLPQNAIVKITDTNGTLIYQGRATGGQLSWDGYGMQGRRPDSGVLFVFASTEDGGERLACKIFFIR